MNDQNPPAVNIEPPEYSKQSVQNKELPKLRLKFEGKFKSIRSFEWTNIPDFAVITGINGTGKSQFLELLHGTMIDTLHFLDRIEISGKDIKRNEVTFLKGEWELVGTSRLNFSYVQSRKENYFRQFNEVHNYHENKTNNINLYETFQEIINKTGKKIQDISFEEFDKEFPKVFLEYGNQLSIKISEIFLEYRINEIYLKSQQYSEKEIIKELKEKPWDVLRRILETAKLPFDINDPSDYGIWDSFHLQLKHQISNEIVDFKTLSSGEKVLMSLVFYLYNSQEKGIYPKMFLLDEPDAHLHPSMSQQFINVMKKVLVDEMGVQVIMTTHSPSTVAIAPEESIFVANYQGERITKISKDAALKLLTAGIPSFSVNYENRRQIFVESKYDVYFYEKIYQKLSNHLIPEVSLSFISSGETKTDKNGTGISNCGQVINVTKVLRQAGNKFVWGIVDWDKENLESDFIKVLGDGKRYSIESYLLDPLLVGALLLREKFVGRQELGLQTNTTHTDLNFYDNSQLQKIADFVIQKLKEKIKPENDEVMTVQLLNNKEINIPIWYLHSQGHDLESKLLEAFPKLNAIKGNREDALKNAIIDKVIDDLPELISKDFLDVFIKLQAI